MLLRWGGVGPGGAAGCRWQEDHDRRICARAAQVMANLWSRRSTANVLLYGSDGVLARRSVPHDGRQIESVSTRVLTGTCGVPKAANQVVRTTAQHAGVWLADGTV